MRRSIVNRGVLLTLCLTMILGIAAAGRAADPEWLWISAEPEAQEMVYFRKVFDVPGKLKSALLVVSVQPAAFLSQ